MFERLLAIISLIILLPFFILISVGIYIFSGKPIFFKHKRCGYKFNEFFVIKFRTMYPNNGPELTEYNDKRITGIGKIFRKFKLDELPQLVNIIKGEMAFIGPRPESVDIVNSHEKYFTYPLEPLVLNKYKVSPVNEYKYLNIGNNIDKLLTY